MQMALDLAASSCVMWSGPKLDIIAAYQFVNKLDILFGCHWRPQVWSERTHCGWVRPSEWRLRVARQRHLAWACPARCTLLVTIVPGVPMQNLLRWHRQRFYLRLGPWLFMIMSSGLIVKTKSLLFKSSIMSAGHSNLPLILPHYLCKQVSAHTHLKSSHYIPGTHRQRCRDWHLDLALHDSCLHYQIGWPSPYSRCRNRYCQHYPRSCSYYPTAASRHQYYLSDFSCSPPLQPLRSSGLPKAPSRCRMQCTASTRSWKEHRTIPLARQSRWSCSTCFQGLGS